MALTNFAALTDEQKTVWSRDLWRVARNNSFLMRFAGKGANSMITRITELTKSEKGTRAVFQLLADLEGDGVTGDNMLEGNEEAMRAFDQVIGLDQLRHANRLAGRLADQKTVINFRENSRDVLAYWLGDRMDQLGFQTLAGWDYALRPNGAARPVKATGQNLADLEFADHVTAPTQGRHLRVSNGGADITEDGDTSAIAAGDRLSYASLVLAQAYARDNMIRGIKTGNNDEIFHVFVSPTTMAQLKLDPDFIANVRHAGVRGDKNTLFAGANSVMVDGMVIHQFRHSPNTKGMAASSKWGSAGNVDGNRVLICGAQAMGMADIGAPYWVEEGFDYENQHGISIGKMFGLKKPVFHSDVTGRKEDFGTLVLDVANS